MSLEADIVTALGSLVGNRISPDEFPQPLNGPPTWPAIRYTIISVVPFPDLEGDGESDDTTSEPIVQLDLVTTTAKARIALRIQVRDQMKLFVPPALLSSWFNTYDTETKTYRAVMDYTIHGSSASGNSPP